MKKMKTKIKAGRRGKILLTVLVAVMFIGMASAAVIPYFGQIKTTATVDKQAVEIGDGNPIEWHLYNNPITHTILHVLPGGTFCFIQWIRNSASIPVDVTFDRTDGYDDEVTTTYTTTITEEYGGDAYYDDARIMVYKEVGDMTVSEFLSEEFEYTVNVISNPLYAPNLCFWITDGTNTYVVETWGKDWASTGLQTVTIQDFFDGTMGYEVTVDTDYGQANRISDVRPGTYAQWQGTGITEFIEDYETWTVLSAQVRAQAGVAGGQVIRPVTFKAAGTTIDMPDSDTFTSLTMQLGQQMPFYICYVFDLHIGKGTYLLTTTIDAVEYS